jgi:soluble lytic murein transglycosylase
MSKGVRASVLCLLCACSSVRLAGPDALPEPVVDPAPRPDDPGLDPAQLEPYFHDVTGGNAAAALARGDDLAARIAFLELARTLPESSELVPRARFVAAVCAHRSGDHRGAQAELEMAAEALPSLGDHARYLAAVSAFRNGSFERSIELARQVSPGSPVRPDAELLIGDAFRSLGQRVEMEEAYRQYVVRRRDAIRLAEATFRLAEAIEGQLGADGGSHDRTADALRWYRRVTYRYPLTSWATQAREKAAALAARLPEGERAAALELSADEQLEKAQAVARAQRHDAAMREFREVLKLTDPDGPIGCQARLGLGRAAYDGRHRAEAVAELTAAAVRCDDPDVRAWALYIAGRSSTSQDDDRRAVELYTLLEADYPGHRLADDARLRRADAQLRLGDQAEFARLLREMPDVYPEGDMRCEGLWELAWGAYRGGRLAEALETLERASESCEAPDEGAGGRERYWAGRALDRLGRRDEAIRAYEDVIRRNPLTYYMFFAARRLEQLDLPRARQLVASLTTEPDDPDPGWNFDQDVFESQPALARGVELHRLGLKRMASLELTAARVAGADSPDVRWLVAVLHHQVGDYPVSHNIARRELTGWRESYPVGSGRRYWLIAYPRGYEDIVRREASAAGVEPELLWAVMREESGFSPGIESYANAVGLLQLLPTTASRFAKGLRADREGLRVPENNVPIAARYLAWLLQRQHGATLLAVSSYNAGEGAVDRWRRAEPGLELDEALESFTYDQTRRYTRRVLTSYATYHFLYGTGHIPSLTGSGPALEVGPISPGPAPGAAGAASSDSD